MKQVPESDLDCIAVHDAAKVSGLSRTAIESLAEAGQLVSEREGHTVFFRTSGSRGK